MYKYWKKILKKWIVLICQTCCLLRCSIHAAPCGWFILLRSHCNSLQKRTMKNLDAKHVQNKNLRIVMKVFNSIIVIIVNTACNQRTHCCMYPVTSRKYGSKIITEVVCYTCRWWMSLLTSVNLNLSICCCSFNYSVVNIVTHLQFSCTFCLASTFVGHRPFVHLLVSSWAGSLWTAEFFFVPY